MVNITQYLSLVVHLTQSCPKNATEWKKASDRLGCQFNSKNLKNRYHCVPDQYRSKLLEFCYDAERSLVQIGNCLELVKSGTINFVGCKSFSKGCPTKFYYSDQMYKFPECAEIDTIQRCFMAVATCEHEKKLNKSLVFSTFEKDENIVEKDQTHYIVLGATLGLVSIVLLIVFIIKRKDIYKSVRAKIRGWREGNISQRPETTLDPEGVPLQHDISERPETTLDQESVALKELKKDDVSERPETTLDQESVALEEFKKDDTSAGPEASLDTNSTLKEFKKKDESQKNRREIGVLELETTTTKNRDEKIVAAIDFGSTFSGYCFSSVKDFQENPLKMRTHKWEYSWSKVFSHKTPTVILLDPDKNFDSFGYQAEENYGELAEAEHHEKHFYFRRFKMGIQSCIEDPDFKIKEMLGKELPAKFVVAQVIRYLKDELLKQIQHTSSDNVYWVLTYPSYWDMDKQRILRSAAVEAGIPVENIVVTEEASVVSYYLNHLTYYKQEGMNIFTDGKKYLLLDAGGGTVDIAVNEIQLDGTSKTLTRHSGPYGGTTVDNAFEKALSDIVGADLIKEFKIKNTSSYIELLQNLEAVKRKEASKEARKVIIRVPILLKDIYEKKYGKSVEDRVQETEYKGKIFWEDDKFRMTKNFFESLFDEAFNGITNLIDETLQRDISNNTEIILLCGGFSESTLLQQMILDKYLKCNVVILPEPGLGVLRGGVLYGHQPFVRHFVNSMIYRKE